MVKKNIKTGEGDTNLYVCMHNTAEKRKSILMGIKNSLVLQEEFEKSKEIRSQKSLTLKEIKSTMDLIKDDYETLKQQLPHVKEGMSFVEKELRELEDEITVLRHETIEDIEIKKMKQKQIREFSKKKQKPTLKKTVKKAAEKAKAKKSTQKAPVKKKWTKLDRIKNNLSVIESKLKNV